MIHAEDKAHIPAYRQAGLTHLKTGVYNWFEFNPSKKASTFVNAFAPPQGLEPWTL